MNRRSFLTRCGLAAVGTTLLPALSPVGSCLQAAPAARPSPLPQLSVADRALLGLLSAYSAGVSFWGSQVFARAAGIASPADTPTQLRVQVTSVETFVAFLRSDAERRLQNVHATDGNVLSFRFMDTAYAVTNLLPEDSAASMTTNAVSSRRRADGTAATEALAHETLVYYPATDTLNDPHAVLGKRRVDLAAKPSGGLPTQFQTLLRGWLESQKYGLKLGKKFQAFEDTLLASTPTTKAAKKVTQTLLDNISALAAAFSVDALRPLLTSPLVSASLQQTLGLDGAAALAAVEKLRAALAGSDYTDAALWLAALLPTQLQDGTATQWLDLFSGDAATNALNLASLFSAQALVQTSALSTY